VLLLASILLVSAYGLVLAGEAKPPAAQPQPIPTEPAKIAEELRSATGKITYARLQFIKSKPELAEAYKQLQEKEKALRKEFDDFYAKLRPMSPDIDALEKRKEELEAARKKALPPKGPGRKEKK
jgi:hypothetical protein